MPSAGPLAPGEAVPSPRPEVGGGSWQAQEPELGGSLGILETRGFLSLVQGLDAMLKAAEVHPLRYESLGGGLVAVCFQGEISSVKVALESGTMATQAGEKSRGVVLANPNPELFALLASGAPWITPDQGIGQREGAQGKALGFVETHGFVSMVAALDAMAKAAQVEIEGFERAEDRFTAVVSGDVGSLLIAAEAGARAAGEKVLGWGVIPRPSQGMGRVLPALGPQKGLEGPRRPKRLPRPQGKGER